MKLTYRLSFTALTVLVCAILGGIAGVSTNTVACAAAQVRSGALIIVKLAEGDERPFCISFEGDGMEADPEGISGLAALEKTGLATATRISENGEETVCKIGETGTDNCDPKVGSWSYFHGTPLHGSGSWEASPTGPGSYRLHHGDMDAWVWTPRNAKSTPPLLPANSETMSSTCPSPTQSPRSPDSSLGRTEGQGSYAGRPANSERSNLLPWLAIGVLAGIALVAISSLRLERFRRDK